MSKAKVVSISEWRKNAAANSRASVLDWNGSELTVKKVLAIDEMAAFAESSADYCFSGIDGAYSPEFKDFAVRMNTVKFYSNVKIPENVETLYDLLYTTDIVEKIISNVNGDQYSALLSAIDKKIEYMADVRRAEEEKRVNDAIAALGTLIDSVNNLFSGIGREDIEKIVSAVGDSGLNEERLMDAYFKSRDKADKWRSVAAEKKAGKK